MSGVLVAVLAAGSINIGKVLQKRGTVDLPKFSLTKACFTSYVRNWHWLTGFLADIFGGVMTLIALSLSPVSVVQPVMGSGLGVAAVFSHFYLRENLSKLEWLGCTLVMFGTMGIGMSSGEDAEAPEIAAVLTFFLILIAVVIGGVAELQLRKKIVSVETATGLQIGLCFGLSAVASRIGMLISQQLELPVAVVCGIIASVGLTSVGFLLQTRGMKEGRAVVIITLANMFAMIAAVLFGLLALGERLPENPPVLFGRLFSLTFVLYGTFLLTQGAVNTGSNKKLGAGGAGGGMERVKSTTDLSSPGDMISLGSGGGSAGSAGGGSVLSEPHKMV